MAFWDTDEILPVICLWDNQGSLLNTHRRLYLVTSDLTQNADTIPNMGSAWIDVLFNQGSVANNFMGLVLQ